MKFSPEEIHECQQTRGHPADIPRRHKAPATNLQLFERSCGQVLPDLLRGKEPIGRKVGCRKAESGSESVPQIRAIRSEADESAAWLQHPVHVGEEEALVQHVLQYRDTDDHINAVVLDSFQFFRIVEAKCDFLFPLRRITFPESRGYHRSRKIYTDPVAYERRKRKKMVASTAAYVEKRDLGGFRQVPPDQSELIRNQTVNRTMPFFNERRFPVEEVPYLS